MAERDLRAVSRDIEDNVPPADFSRIAERGHSLRRRRRAAQAAGLVVAAGAAVAAVSFGVDHSWTTDDQAPVAPRPDRSPVTATAQQILAHARATVVDDSTRTSDTGAVLHLVVVPSPAGGGCPAERRSALVWQDDAGGRVAWSEGVAGRRIEAVPGGFVVGAVLPECVDRLGGDESPGAYVVDETGERTEVVWSAGAEDECATDPAAPRCSVDATTAAGELLAAPVQVETSPDAAHEPVAADGADVWARSADSREIVWSEDGGRSWQSRSTALEPGPGANVQVTAAGDWMVFYAWPEVEVSSDHGTSWQVRDLEEALAPILLAEETVTVTPAGRLVGVSYPVGGPPVLFASTDDEWTRFVEADVRTAFGTIDVRTAGDWLWVPDQGRTWLSGDGGLSWTLLDPLR